jgi:hypothetical protein
VIACFLLLTVWLMRGNRRRILFYFVLVLGMYLFYDLDRGKSLSTFCQVHVRNFESVLANSISWFILQNCC